MKGEKIYLRPAWRTLWLNGRLYAGVALVGATQIPFVQQYFEWIRRIRVTGVNLDHDYAYWLQILGWAAIGYALLHSFFHRIQWRYMIGPAGVESIRGVIGKDERRVEYRNTRYVRMRQSFLQRLLLIGDVMIGTAATDEPEVVFFDISRPGKWKDLVLTRQREEDASSGKRRPVPESA